MYARRVDEDALTGAPVGAAVTADDSDAGDTLHYTLSGSDLFTIDTDSGQIRVKTAGSLDYDDPAKRLHVVIVTASDSSNASASIPVDISIADVNEPPVAVADAAGSLAEDTEITIEVLANDSDPEDDRSELTLRGGHCCAPRTSGCERTRWSW